MHALFISGIFMSFFIVFLLLTKKNKALTDRILATWVAVIGIHLLGFFYEIFATHPMSKVIQTDLLLVFSIFLVIREPEFFFKRIK